MKKKSLSLADHAKSLELKLASVKVSGKFTAMLDAILDIRPRRTSPALQSIIITSDEIILGQVEGDIGMNEILGSYSDLSRNLKGVSEVAELNYQEVAVLASRIFALGAPVNKQFFQ